MKYLFTFLVLFFQHFAFAQVQKMGPKAVSLTKHSTVLNREGESRYFPIKPKDEMSLKIPEKAKEVYLVFSVSKGFGSTANALEQLEKAIKEGAPGSGKNLMSYIAEPIQEANCEIFLLDSAGEEVFWSRDESIETLQTLQKYLVSKKGAGKIIITPAKGYNYIGIRNPTAGTMIAVAVEVIAITEEVVSTDYSKWSADGIAMVTGVFEQKLKLDEVAPGLAAEITKCIMSIITENMKPYSFFKSKDFPFEDFMKQVTDSCIQKITGVKKTEHELKANVSLELSWITFIEDGDVDIAIEYCKNALSNDKTLGMAEANLGLFYLVKKDKTLSRTYYASAIATIKKEKVYAKKQFTQAIRAINDALKKYPDLNYKEILSQLQKEHDSL